MLKLNKLTLVLAVMVMLLSLCGYAAADVIGTSSSFRMPQLDYSVPEEQPGIDVRARADGMSEIITTVPADAEIAILGTEGNWYRVSVDGVTGYIFGGDIAGDDENKVDLSGAALYVFSSRRANMTEGETVYLTSQVVGVDGYRLEYQWQVNRGGGFQDVPGATGPGYSFAASVESLSWDWQLIVNVYEP